jgi:hypothetical protein
MDTKKTHVTLNLDFVLKTYTPKQLLINKQLQMRLHKTNELEVPTVGSTTPNQYLILKGHLYLSSVWLVVNLRMDTRKICVEKRLDYMLNIC